VIGFIALSLVVLPLLLVSLTRRCKGIFAISGCVAGTTGSGPRMTDALREAIWATMAAADEMLRQEGPDR
jgi:hypothetical protein